MGNYYHEDYDMGNDYRMKYFDYQFESLSKKLARELGITLSQFWSDINNFTSFKNKLRVVFSMDSSLANYVSGMSEKDFRLFYQRPLIQEIVGQEVEEVEFIDVHQIEKEPIKFYKAKYKEKKTGLIKRTIAKESKFKVRGKIQIRYRSSLGRFVSKV